jgi:hypothetical protein
MIDFKADVGQVLLFPINEYCIVEHCKHEENILNHQNVEKEPS